MRTAPLAAALAILLAGCVSVPPRDAAAQDALSACRAAPATEHVLYFGAGNRLVPARPPPGSAPGNGFAGGFLSNDLKGWLSEPLGAGLWLVGNVTLSFWARSNGQPAPLPDLTGTGQSYRFFNQFGSDRTFQPATATEYGPPYAPRGAVTHYEERLPTPPGGFVVEEGQRVRVLLTDLQLEGGSGGGHDILFGGDTPSQVRFLARCYPTFLWSGPAIVEQDVLLPASQGAGALPDREGVNRVRVDVPLPPETSRLTIRLQQANDASPAKDDVDLVLLDADGRPVWSLGSPYSDESGMLWQDNLELFKGRLTVQVDSYSAAAYQGHLSVVAEAARLPPPA